MQPAPSLSAAIDESISGSAQEWRFLSLLNIFRSFIATAFTLLYLTDKLLPPLGSFSPLLFFRASTVYLLLSMLLWFFYRTRKLSFIKQIYAGFSIDTLLITTLMYSSGGIESGLGVLLVIPIAVSTIVLSFRIALGLAAFATIVLLTQQSVYSLNHAAQSSYPIAGLLGLTYFVTTFLVSLLARRIRESEALAQRRGIDLANLAQLTQHIIQRMQTGVVVIDGHGAIRLINEAATQMFSMPAKHADMTLHHFAPELEQQWLHWQADQRHQANAIHLKQHHIDILPRFAQIGDNIQTGALIFLQDMAAMAQQAQQLQLASLGRLTASIAHEIRNPLAAISHAGQLLAESEHLDKSDIRLTQIITDHTQRLNTIVENVMSVSRRQPSQVQLFSLQEFLQKFLQEYCAGQHHDPDLFQMEVSPPELQVRFDSNHLRQVLVNLCENALRHSTRSTMLPKVILHASFGPAVTRPHLDIIDSGPGVGSDALPHLFEPFFTTEAKGTGLGLYLSRELAEANQAHLNYIGNPGGPGIFRITFQDPRRQFE